MILDQYGKPFRKLPRSVSLRYDAARWTNDNKDYWSNADYLAPNTSNDPTVRSRLRSRSRYEAVENNSYLKGIVLTICNDFTSSGPTIQFVDKRLSDTARQELEMRFNEEYASRINLREIVWQLRHARCVDGEGFAIQYTDRDIPDTEVQTNWEIIEAEQCQQPMREPRKDDRRGYNYFDGVKYDRHGVPKAYHMLYSNPNDTNEWSADPMRGRWIPVDYVIHWTRRERPWLRGIPETTPALPLCAYLRRYNLAVLSAAETAASFAGVLESTQPANPNPLDFGTSDEDTNAGCEYDPFDSFPIERGMFTNLPDGYSLSQLKAEQPTEQHAQFVDTVLREIARCMLVPFNLAVGFSGGYNMASGTLDRQAYNAAIKSDHYHAETHLLRKVVMDWWFEAIRIPGYIDDIYNEFIEPPKFRWIWDQQPEHADPAKVAQAIKTYWDMGAVTDEQIQTGRFGRDPEEHYASLERQTKRRNDLGLPLPGIQKIDQGSKPNNENDEDDQDDDNASGADENEQVSETADE